MDQEKVKEIKEFVTLGRALQWIKVGILGRLRDKLDLK